MTTDKHPTADPTTEASQHGEFDTGSTGAASRRNTEQSRAVGQAVDPVAERARRAREGHNDRADYGATGQTDWADKKTP